MNYVVAQDAMEFVRSLPHRSVPLFLFDPPYYGIVDETWDNAWPSVNHYVNWFCALALEMHDRLTTDGSIVFFGGLGRHGVRPLLGVVNALEQEHSPYTFRNWITWGKRRAYGKSHDYLYCREEILWYSASDLRTSVRFNIPLSEEKRGYKGFNPKYPAKSEYKRITNVWSDIPELMRPERTCQKPLPLLGRLVRTHSHPGDLVVDPFSGWGTTGCAAIEAGRAFLGSEAIDADALAADARIRAVADRVVAVPANQEPTFVTDAPECL